MKSKIEEMIDNGSLELNQFLTMHPFSATQNDVYNIALGDVDYFNQLYVRDISQYAYLAKICSLIRNSEKKLCIITGFRGCGKTNFLHFIKHISETGEIGPTLSEQYRLSLSLMNKNEELTSELTKNYSDVKKRISVYINGEIRDEEMENEALLEWYRKHLNGDFRYINFDIGSMGRNDGDAAFVYLIFFRLHDSIEIALKEDSYYSCVENIRKFIGEYGWEIRRNFDYQIKATESLNNFWNRINPLLDNYKEKYFLDPLFDELEKLSLSQILLVFLLWEYTLIISSNKEGMLSRKIIYLFDNIDIISGTEDSAFESKTAGFWSFIWNARVFFNNISNRQMSKEDEYEEIENSHVLKYIELYKNTKFIFAMRETTAMYITDHLRDRLRGLMGHFDMSCTFDKVVCLQKKLEYAITLIAEGRISNQQFIRAINNLNNLLDDKLFTYDLVQLYNNDYRTFATALSSICLRNPKSIMAANELFKPNDIRAFGSRCILYRCFFNGFASWHYFDSLGIFAPAAAIPKNINWKKYQYTLERVILTTLINIQGKSPSKFFLETDESVSLATLYKYLEGIIDLDDFVNVIDSMYALRNEKFWSHLVTFDNVIAYSEINIKKYLESTEHSLSDIYIRITPAGSSFIKTMCVHYEYFTCRFSKHFNGSLFELVCIDTEEKKQIIENVIEDVFNYTKQCCKNQKEFNQRVRDITGYTSYTQLLNTQYYFENKYHEERVIHQHISYLESFRKCVALYTNNIAMAKSVESSIIKYIKKYLELLKYDANDGIRIENTMYYSHNSKLLYKELMMCIKKIEDEPERSKDVDITREYYRNHLANKPTYALH